MNRMAEIEAEFERGEITRQQMNQRLAEARLAAGNAPSGPHTSPPGEKVASALSVVGGLTIFSAVLVFMLGISNELDPFALLSLVLSSIVGGLVLMALGAILANLRIIAER